MLNFYTVIWGDPSCCPSCPDTSLILHYVGFYAMRNQMKLNYEIILENNTDFLLVEKDRMTGFYMNM